MSIPKDLKYTTIGTKDIEVIVENKKLNFSFMYLKDTKEIQINHVNFKKRNLSYFFKYFTNKSFAKRLFTKLPDGVKLHKNRFMIFPDEKSHIFVKDNEERNLFYLQCKDHSTKDIYLTKDEIELILFITNRLDKEKLF